MKFIDMIKARQEKVNSLLCVGLDLSLKATLDFPGWRSYPQIVCNFVDAVHPFVCAFKPNLAFYESSGGNGMQALGEVVSHIRKAASDIPIIGDGKRTDIGATNKEYVTELFGGVTGFFNFDATTVNPYFGGTALKNFLDCEDKGIIVLCRTSNPDSGELQDREIRLWDNERNEFQTFTGRHISTGTVPLYQWVAYRVANTWNVKKNCGLVVGATYPDELANIRNIVGSGMPILIPGIGTQGGDLERTMEANGGGLMVVNVSSAVAGKYKSADYAEVAAAAAMNYRDEINQYR